MDVAVTGSTGLIGTALLGALRGAGHHPIPVVRGKAAGHDEIAWNPSKGEIDAGAFEGIGGVIHLAGAGIADKRWNAERKRLILESRTKPTHLLADTLAKLQKPPSVLLSGSAVGFYGDRGDEVLDESSPKGEGFLTNVCVAWEGAARPAIDAGIRTCLLRTGIVMSADGGALGKVLTPFKLGVGGRLVSGTQYWPWISIDDQCRAIIHLLRRTELSGPINLTGPEPVTNKEWTKALGEVLGRPTVLPLPKPAMSLALGPELADALLFTSQRVVPKALLDDGFVFNHKTVTECLAGVLGKDLELA